MRNAIEQAAYEVGLATAKYDMLVASHQGTMSLDQAGISVKIGPLKSAGPSLNKPGRIISPKAQTSPKVARGVKKAAGPRTAGVKKGILDLIASKTMSAQEIIAATGFNANSVRATLMALKKNGLAMNDDKLWTAAVHSGNSESASAGY